MNTNLTYYCLSERSSLRQDLLAEVADHLATNNDGYNIMGLCIKTLNLGSKVSIELLFRSFGFLPTRFLRHHGFQRQCTSSL